MASAPSAPCSPRSMAARGCGTPAACGAARRSPLVRLAYRRCASPGGASPPPRWCCSCRVAVLALRPLRVRERRCCSRPWDRARPAGVASGYTALVAAAFGPDRASRVAAAAGAARSSCCSPERLRSRRSSTRGCCPRGAGSAAGSGGRRSRRPWATAGAAAYFRAGLWELIRGGAKIRQPETKDLARRYAELLADNLGQPGFRELLIVVHDLDARRDLVFALLGPDERRSFFLRKPVHGGDRRSAEAFDLAGVARDQSLPALAGALAIPGLTEPALDPVCPREPLARRGAPAVRSSRARWHACSRRSRPRARAR